MTEIEQLRARVAELEKERDHHKAWAAHQTAASAAQAEQIKVAREALKAAAKAYCQAHCALIVDEALAKLGEL